ncbi:TetR/AcrR family transcriptional regulator [Phenylobacterium soli]|uniref:TetR/AcrR family transcriptional regulator n=1 Tax=Phenylobacterium soli TaxID=2170551 RepID=A0A328AJV1_9CAUL|nr:TetR/AcrR family transcriptional regulator [Phenylobacterium soli]RAK55162.1 TetR/AcrR family transcriptional regulator [Phenylobacterium soli]
MSIAPPDRRPRARRSPEAARENILAAAESLLLEKGPQALKLTDVAARAGIAHATVLHHFGSIGDVQTALMERMIRQLVVQILEGEPAAEPGGPETSAQALFDAFESRGAARLAAWLELTGEARRLTMVREAVQEVIANRMAHNGLPAEATEDLVLVSVVLAMGVGLFGQSLAQLMGRPPETSRRLALDLLRASMTTLRQP